jgi:hypothetical protein
MRRTALIKSNNPHLAGGEKRIVFRAHGVVNMLEVSRLVGAVLYMLFSFRGLVIPQDQDAKSRSSPKVSQLAPE